MEERRQPSPQILSHDQIFRAQVGESLVLPCQVANLGTYVLMWKQQKRVLTAGTLVVRKDYRMRLRDDFSLELSQLKPDDQGTYTCEIDVMGKPISITHKVTHHQHSWARPAFISIEFSNSGSFC